jgi:hypothetical protein
MLSLGGQAVLDSKDIDRETLKRAALESTGAGRIWRTTPVRLPDTATDEIATAENTRRHAQNRELSTRMSRGETIQKIREDFFRTQPPTDRERLANRVILANKLKGVEPWWLDLREMPPEAAAKAYVARLIKASPAEAEEMQKMLHKVPGIASPRFLAAVRRERAKANQ